MNSPLAVSSCVTSPHGRHANAVQARGNARYALPAGKQHGSSSPVTSFVERRRQMLAADGASTRPPHVLVFAGTVSGLLLSALLILFSAFVLAFIEVQWANASRYCVTTVLIVFGAAATVLCANVGNAATLLLTRIEPAVERRAYYLHLSALNAFENLRTLEKWRQTTAMPAADRALTTPISCQAELSRRASDRVAPAADRGDATSEERTEKTSDNWAWADAESCTISPRAA